MTSCTPPTSVRAQRKMPEYSRHPPVPSPVRSVTGSARPAAHCGEDISRSPGAAYQLQCT